MIRCYVFWCENSILHVAMENKLQAFEMQVRRYYVKLIRAPNLQLLLNNENSYTLGMCWVGRGEEIWNPKTNNRSENLRKEVGKKNIEFMVEESSTMDRLLVAGAAQESCFENPDYHMDGQPPVIEKAFEEEEEEQCRTLVSLLKMCFLSFCIFL